MPYEISWEKCGVYRRYYGHVTDREVAETMNITHSSQQFDMFRYAILDFLDVTGFEVTDPSFIPMTAAIDNAAAKTNPNIKIAIVATDPDMIDLAEAYRDHELTPYPTQIFSNLADARSWASVTFPLKLKFNKALA